MTDTARLETYGRSVFLAIVGDEMTSFLECREHAGRFDDRPPDSVRVDERGVWVHPTFDGLAWTYLCDVGAASTKNPLDEPALPFEFTAAELAAFMLDGVGYFLRQKWGRWSEGPDALALQGLGVQGGKAKQALQSAYWLYREAERVVGQLDERYLSAEDLDERFEFSQLEDEDEARHNDSSSSYRQAIERVRARTAAERDEAVDAQGIWRRKMVHELLRPGPARGDQPLRAVQRQRAQEAAILAKLAALGVDPKAVPPAPIGKQSPVKQKVRAELGYSVDVMNKAWQRLRSAGDIRDADTSRP